MWKFFRLSIKNYDQKLPQISSRRLQEIISAMVKSSHRRCSVRKSVLGNFAKFTGKHLRQSLFFNKVVGRRLHLFYRTLPDDCFWRNHKCYGLIPAKVLHIYSFPENVLMDTLLAILWIFRNSCKTFERVRGIESLGCVFSLWYSLRASTFTFLWLWKRRKLTEINCK